jgi:ectoine hydroxylase-related dioxygenase (phytanoyl-CoA dioxygenase family)
MNGNITMQVNQFTAVQAFQMWADANFKTPVTVKSVANDGQDGFELVFEPTEPSVPGVYPQLQNNKP